MSQCLIPLHGEHALIYWFVGNSVILMYCWIYCKKLIRVYYVFQYYEIYWRYQLQSSWMLLQRLWYWCWHIQHECLEKKYHLFQNLKYIYQFNVGLCLCVCLICGVSVCCICENQVTCLFLLYPGKGFCSFLFVFLCHISQNSTSWYKISHFMTERSV